MRLWQQTYGSSTAYSNYEDVWHSGNLTTTNKANYDTAYGWGNHASAGYLTSYTDTNTTYSAGTGISLSGTTFSLTTPSLSGSVTISEDNDGVQLTWSVSSDSVDYYEVWSSVGSANDFVLIGKVLASDLSGSTVSMTDSGYDTSSTTNYYKVFAIKNGLYSNALSASQAVSNTVSDPANMSVVPSTESFLVQYDLPDSPILASVSIKKYAATTESAANNESAATTIFTGTRDSFAYAVPAADVSKYHKFWVVSNTRT
jgi:hypothetical protein